MQQAVTDTLWGNMCNLCACTLSPGTFTPVETQGLAEKWLLEEGSDSKGISMDELLCSPAGGEELPPAQRPPLAHVPGTCFWCTYLMLRGAVPLPQTSLFCRGKKPTPPVQGAALPSPPGHALELPATPGSAAEGRAAGRRHGCPPRAALVPAGGSQLGGVISIPGHFSVSYLGYLQGKG